VVCALMKLLCTWIWCCYWWKGKPAHLARWKSLGVSKGAARIFL